ncbi:NACHT domain-containing protein [Lentzea sp. HUAS TT2]|uniref:NACHT domain-containing protein n=1 Tax=Lentzea sp. HUAS TT2 TaxID=3447454 RepID=UPI003F72BFD7
MAQEPERLPRAGFVVATLTVLVGAGVGLVTNAASSDPRWPWLLDHLRQHAWTWLGLLLVVSMVLAVSSLVVGRRQRAAVRAQQFQQNREALLAQVRARLDEQLGVGKLRRVINVPISRHAHNHGVVRVGGLQEVANSARAHCRLVVVGAVGSGKSTLLLRIADELASGGGPDAPIPVPVNLSTWNPAQERLDDVIRKAITGVRQGGRQRRRAWWRLRRRTFQVTPDDLVSSRLVVPLLDGLDEIPQDLWDDARRELGSALGARDRQFALACAEYAFPTLVPDDVTTTAGTQVVRIEPVSLTSAEDYLVKSSVDPARWRPVLDAMRVESHPVAVSLSTPLMLYLARVVFEDSRREPAELLAPRLGTREAVEAELLRSYVPAAYAPREQSPDLATESAVRFEAGDAERWLRYLAGFLDANQSTVFRWWDLSEFSPAPKQLVSRWNWTLWVIVTGFAIPAFLAGFALLGLMLICLGWVLGKVLRWIPDPDLALPDELQPLHAWITEIDVSSLAHSFVTTPAVLLSAVVLAAVAGLGTSTWLMMEAGEQETFAAVGARDSIRADARITRVRAVTAFVLASAIVFLVKDGVWGWFAQTAAPWIDRMSQLPATVSAWAEGQQNGIFWWGTGISLLAGLVAAGAVVVNSAWWHLRVGQAKRVTLRQLPADLLTFLDDANRRGVLRRYGPVFAFRHRRVQWYLADRDRAGRTPEEVLDEARELVAAKRFSQAVDQLTRLANYDTRASVELALIHERWARQRRWNFNDRQDRAQRLVRARSWWEQAVEEGDQSAAVGLAQFLARRLDSYPGTLIGGARSISTHHNAVRTWEELASMTTPPVRDEIIALLDQRVSVPPPTFLHDVMRDQLVKAVARLRSTSPPPVDELHWWTSIALGDVAAQALQHAAHRSGVLRTGDLLAALIEADPRAEDWARFTLHTGSPSPDDLRRADDTPCAAADPPLPLGADGLVTVSQDVMAALRLLPLMSTQYGMNPIPAGALALAILSVPGGGAARMLRAYSGLDDPALRQAVKDHLLGAPGLPELVV